MFIFFVCYFDLFGGYIGVNLFVDFISYCIFYWFNIQSYDFCVWIEMEVD